MRKKSLLEKEKNKTKSKNSIFKKIEQNLKIIVNFYREMDIIAKATGQNREEVAKNSLVLNSKHFQEVKNSIKFLERCNIEIDNEETRTIPYSVICKIAELKYLMIHDTRSVLFALAELQKYAMAYPQAFPVISSATYSYYAKYPLIVNRIQKKLDTSIAPYFLLIMLKPHIFNLL